jgi:hypothetical protein
VNGDGSIILCVVALSVDAYGLFVPLPIFISLINQQ